MAADTLTDLRHRAENAVFRALLAVLRLLPYRRRVAFMGWVMSAVVAPVAGWRRRIRDNLAYAWPDLPEAEVARLVRAVPDNMGRTIAELYAGPEFAGIAAEARLEGAGLDFLLENMHGPRPIVVVSGHYGNYLAPLAAFADRGARTVALYNPMKNPYFQTHYEIAMKSHGAGMAGRDRRSFAELLRHLREGGAAAILNDQYMAHGADLSFFGRPAPTALSAAELALKFDAPLVPVYARRNPDGLSFTVIVEEPIPHGDPAEMTQAANDSLERLVREEPAQWFWIHRRWKPERAARRARQMAKRA